VCNFLSYSSGVHPEQIAMALLKSRYAEEESKSDES